MQALSQLSYTPTKETRIIVAEAAQAKPIMPRMDQLRAIGAIPVQWYSG